MAQEYTMIESGLSPATSPAYRAEFRRATRLFAASQRRPSYGQGASVVVSEHIEFGRQRRPIPCIYPQKMPRAYGPSTDFDIDLDYHRLGDIAWTPRERDTLVIVYRGADGGEGTVRMPMPSAEDNGFANSFDALKSDYLKKLTGGSGVVDTRSVVHALRKMDAPKVAKVAKVAKIEPVSRLPRDDSSKARVVYLDNVVAELRDEVIRLTNELNDARECADTDAADAARAHAVVAELQAEINGLRYLRPKIDALLVVSPTARA